MGIDDAQHDVDAALAQLMGLLQHAIGLPTPAAGPRNTFSRPCRGTAHEFEKFLGSGAGNQAVAHVL
jgi:hypothetical protein